MVTLVTSGAWVLLLLGLYALAPSQEPAARLLFVRFHAFLTTYAVLLFVVWQRPASLKKLTSLGTILVRGWLALAAGTVALWLLTCRLSPSLHARLPNFWLLWLVMAANLTALVSLYRLLLSLPRLAYGATAALFSIGMLCLTTLFYADWLLAVFPGLRDYLIPLFLYANPLAVISSCFPHYDYLRDSSLYLISSLATAFGPFRYPQPTWAALYYAGIAGGCLAAGNVRAWAKRQKHTCCRVWLEPLIFMICMMT